MRLDNRYEKLLVLVHRYREKTDKTSRYYISVSLQEGVNLSYVIGMKLLKVVKSPVEVGL